MGSVSMTWKTIATVLTIVVVGQIVAARAFPTRLGGPERAALQATVVGDKVPFKAHAFQLQDVRLLDGPFKQAQKLDQDYLLSLDQDRLLHNFRVNAGTPSSAKPPGR